jgi:hypothetical protein
MPDAIVTGNVPAWIQPRQVGLSSSGRAGEASTSGRLAVPLSRRSSAFTAASEADSRADGRESSSATSSKAGATSSCDELAMASP